MREVAGVEGGVEVSVAVKVMKECGGGAII